MKLPMLSAREVINVLSKEGFKVRRRKGSHVILVKETTEGKIAVVVPDHKEIDKGTLLEIIRQAKLTKEEFIAILKEK